MYKSRKGFTLAEVLMTLLIIGIVASMVIPALINDSNEAEYNVGIKKINAELSNALKMIQINNGGFVNIGNGNTNADRIAMRNDFCSVMTCVQTDTLENISGGIKYKFYKGTVSTWPGAPEYPEPAAILNNGAFIYFHNVHTNCNRADINACGSLIVDINGKKGPNMQGYDLNHFWIARKNGNGGYIILPFGAQGDKVDGNPPDCQPGRNSGWLSDSCTAQRLMDPAHMP